MPPALRPVALDHCSRLLNHGPVTILTSAHAGRRNIMAASWAMPLDFVPPKLVVVLDSRTWTHELIDASGEFGLQIPTRAIAAQTLAVGSVSGRDEDKFATLGLRTFAASRIAAPLLAGCAAWFECKVIRDHAAGHDLLLAEVVAAWSDPTIYCDNRWVQGVDAAQRTIHYVAGGQFFATGEPFTVPGTDAAPPP